MQLSSDNVALKQLSLGNATLVDGLLVILLLYIIIFCWKSTNEDIIRDLLSTEFLGRQQG